jgi:hypothetical protein
MAAMRLGIELKVKKLQLDGLVGILRPRSGKKKFVE